MRLQCRIITLQMMNDTLFSKANHRWKFYVLHNHHAMWVGGSTSWTVFLGVIVIPSISQRNYWLVIACTLNSFLFSPKSSLWFCRTYVRKTIYTRLKQVASFNMGKYPNTFLRRELDVCSVTRMVTPLADISRKGFAQFESTAVDAGSVCISFIGTGIITCPMALLGIESRQDFLTCAKR